MTTRPLPLSTAESGLASSENASTDAIATLLVGAAETVTTFASNDEDAVLTLNTSPRPIR